MRRIMVVVAAVLAVLVAGVGAFAVGRSVGDGHDGSWPGMHRTVGVRADPDDGPWGVDGHGHMHGTQVTSERDYLAHMVAHHREAVAAAKQLERSDRPEMRAFGRSIVATQTAQIEQMNAWLERWYPDRPRTSEYRPMMRDLSGLSGDRLDRTFLEDMIGHHMVAVMTSQQLLALDLARHSEVAELAVSIRDDQRAEIRWMHRALAAWFGVGRAGGMGGPGMRPGMGWRTGSIGGSG